MNYITRKAMVIGIVAGLLVLCDSIFVKLLNIEGSFTWVAFVSWTVFFGSATKERLKAIVGYVIGFLLAVVIIKLGDLLGFIPMIFGISISSIIATMVVNFACIELENLDKYFPISISGIFVGIAMTFSGLGVGMNSNTIQSSLIMLLIIVVYGILGLLCGWASIKFGTKK